MNERNGPNRSNIRRLAQYTSIIVLLPSCILAGYFIGNFLDDSFGTFPWLSMLFLFLGSAAGLVQVFRILNS
ncbi:MAG: AtpZ/AtpI family protein [Acidobacteriota bacterium]